MSARKDEVTERAHARRCFNPARSLPPRDAGTGSQQVRVWAVVFYTRGLALVCERNCSTRTVRNQRDQTVTEVPTIFSA